MEHYYRLLRRAEVAHVPISTLVELTNACNFDCEMCYLDLQPDKVIGALSTEEWKRVFGELADAGCLFLTLSGGELLVRRDWFELASHARDLGFGLRIYTNGALITDDVADQIASLYPLGVEISLHGANAETQDTITRRPGSFEKTVRAARRLVARDVPVKLKCVIMRRNYKEYPLIRELAAEIGANCYFDAEVTPKNNGSREPVAFSTEDDELRRVAADIWAEKGACKQAEAFDFEARLDETICAAGRRTCHIGPTGGLYPCTQWPTPVGSLRERSFRELWGGSPVFLDIREKRMRSLSGCSGCGLTQICTPCMALSLLEHGDLKGPSHTKCKSSAAVASSMGIHAPPAGLALRGEEPIAPPPQFVELRRRVPAR